MEFTITDKMIKRFEMKYTVDEETGCWNWAVPLAPGGGPGNFCVKSRHKEGLYPITMLAHRFSYIMKHGELPSNIYVKQTCGNRQCVNPAHLELVSRTEQAQRRPLKEEHLDIIKRHLIRLRFHYPEFEEEIVKLAEAIQ